MSREEVARYVTKCYIEVLKRKPEPTALKHYTNLILNKNLTRSGLLVALRSSKEYKNILKVRVSPDYPMPPKLRGLQKLSGVKKSRRVKSPEKQLRFSVCYCVLNEELFLDRSLRSVYDFADEIIVFEGARETMWWQHANLDGSSIDDTVNIIKDFPDPWDKIKLFQGKWNSKVQMKNEMLKQATGDWILICAGDEVYSPRELKLLKAFTEKHPEAVCIKFPFIHFIWDENHRIITTKPQKNMRDWSGRHQRFFKNMVGLQYKRSHSDVENSEGTYLIAFRDKTLWFPKVHVYHYGYCRSVDDIRRKLEFFCKRDKAHLKHGFETIAEYIEAHPYFSRKGDPRMGERIISYKGKKLGVKRRYVQGRCRGKSLTILSLNFSDLGGLSFNLCNAINKLTPHHAFSFVTHRPFTRKPVMRHGPKSKQLARKLFKKADVLHINEHWNRITTYGINPKDFRGKTVIFHAHGTIFRRRESKLDLLRRAFPQLKIITSTPDLCAYAPDSTWFPSIIPIATYRRSYKIRRNAPPIVYYSPSQSSTNKMKGVLPNVVKQLRSEGVKLRYKVTTGVLHRINMQRKSKADIYYDEISPSPFYGVNAIEAGAFKMAVICNMNDYARTYMKNHNVDCPFLLASDVSQLKEVLSKLVIDKSFRDEVGIAGNEYVKKMHSEEVCVKRFLELIK